jgi:hypothetical protein
MSAVAVAKDGERNILGSARRQRAGLSLPANGGNRPPGRFLPKLVGASSEAPALFREST